MKKNSSMLEFASEQLQGDREFMLEVVEHLIRRRPDDGSGCVDYVGTKRGMLAACKFLNLDKRGNKPDLAARLVEWYETRSPKRKKQKVEGRQEEMQLAESAMVERARARVPDGEPPSRPPSRPPARCAPRPR